MVDTTALQLEAQAYPEVPFAEEECGLSQELLSSAPEGLAVYQVLGYLRICIYIFIDCPCKPAANGDHSLGPQLWRT